MNFTMTLEYIRDRITWKPLTYFQNSFKPITTQYHFIDVLNVYIAVENVVRKGEIACEKQFLLFSQCFIPYMVHIFDFKCTLKCHLQFGPV